jgi:hypothetical protein
VFWRQKQPCSRGIPRKALPFSGLSRSDAWDCANGESVVKPHVLIIGIIIILVFLYAVSAPKAHLRILTLISHHSAFRFDWLVLC